MNETINSIQMTDGSTVAMCTVRYDSLPVILLLQTKQSAQMKTVM